MQGREVVGVIILAFSTHREVLQAEIDMLHQFAAIAALVVYNRRISFQLVEETYQRVTLESTLQQSSRIDFLNSLVEGNPMTVRGLATQSKQHGLTSKTGYLPLVAQCDCTLVRLVEVAPQLEHSHRLILWWRDGRVNMIQFQSVPDHERQEMSARAEELRQLLEGQLLCPCCQGRRRLALRQPAQIGRWYPPGR